MESHDLKQRFYDDPKHDPRNPSKRIYKNKTPYLNLVKEFGDPYKSKKSKSKLTIEENPIKTIKDIVLLNYVIELDYVDLRNLCKTDKSFASICDDDLLIKGILAITLPNIVFKMNVASLLKSLDNKIEKLLSIHYFDLPKWVNVELFRIKMKKKIYHNLAERINNTLDEYHKGNGKFSKEMLSKNGSLTIRLNKEFLAFALVSNQFNSPDYDDEVDLEANDITLSKEFVHYLMTALGRYKDYHSAQPIIKEVLFIK